MAVVYKKSELGAFLEQLPALIATQTAAARAEAREDDRMEARFAQEEKMLNLRLESEESSRNLGILLNDLEQKQQEVRGLEDTLAKIPGLKPEDLTGGAPVLTSAYQKAGEEQQNIIAQNIMQLNDYIGDLEDAQDTVSEQVAAFDIMAADPKYIGLNKVRTKSC